MFKDFLLIFTYSFILSFLYRMGISPISQFLLSIITFFSPSLKHSKAAFSNLLSKKRHLSGVSPQEEFAKWARLQREVETEQRDFEAKYSHQQQQLWYTNKLISFALRIMTFFSWLWALNKIWKMKTLISGEVIGFTVKPLYLFVISLFAFYRIFSLQKPF